MTECRLVSSTPCNRYLVECSSGLSKLDFTELPREYWGCSFRGVSIDRLVTVLNHGIDVLPTNAVIYTDCFDKAFEYGGWPKVVLAFDADRLQTTFREIPADSSEAELPGGAGCCASPAFLPARSITQADLATVTERVRRRVIRWFRLAHLLDASAAAIHQIFLDCLG